MRCVRDDVAGRATLTTTSFQRRQLEELRIRRRESRQANGGTQFAIQARSDIARPVRVFALTLAWVPACNVFGVVPVPKGTSKESRDAGKTVWL